MLGIVLTTKNTVEVKDFGEPLYKTVGEAVGGYIEPVYSELLKSPFMMIANEEGLLQNLPMNPVASFLTRYYSTGDSGIVGDVVIMKEGEVDGEPDIVGLSNDDCIALMYWLTKKFTFLKEIKHND